MISGITECAYMIPYINGEITCFNRRCECTGSCSHQLALSDMKSVYLDISDIPVELLNLYVHDCIMQENGANCHNLFLLISIYFDSIDDTCKYTGTAYRYTSKKKSKPKVGKFYNFSTDPNKYTGGSGLTQNQKRNHLWQAQIDGINVSQFIDKYCSLQFGTIFKQCVGNYLERIKHLAITEGTIIGKPSEEAVYIETRINIK